MGTSSTMDVLLHSAGWKQMSAVNVNYYILATLENLGGNVLQRTGRAILHTIRGMYPHRTAPFVWWVKIPSQ